MSEDKKSTDIVSESILQFFSTDKVPDDQELKAVTGVFENLAQIIVIDVPRNPERTVALRKLLDARDAVIRAKTYK